MFQAWKMSSSFGSVCGSTSISAFPPSSIYFLTMAASCGKNACVGPAITSYSQVGGHAILRDQVDGLCVVALLLEPLSTVRIARPRHLSVRRFFAVTGDETDRLDLVARDFEDRAGYVLLGKSSVRGRVQGLFSRAGRHNDVAHVRGAVFLGDFRLFLGSTFWNLMWALRFLYSVIRSLN